MSDDQPAPAVSPVDHGRTGDPTAPDADVPVEPTGEPVVSAGEPTPDAADAPVAEVEERPTVAQADTGQVEQAAPSSVSSPSPTTSAERPSVETTADAPDAVGLEDNALEELILPSSVQPPDPLATGAAIGPDGRLRVVEYLGTRGRINRYRAAWQDDGQTLDVELREGPTDHAGLEREARLLVDVRFAMLPTLYAAFDEGGRRYLVIERLDGPTLESALQAGVSAAEAASILVQLAQVLRRLERAGWTVLGLTPSDVRLGRPVKLAKLGSAARLGERPPTALDVDGYSAPELVFQEAITGREAVYTLGAILYRALTRAPLPTEGVELSALSARVALPGGPQLLAGALAPADERLDLDGLYQQALSLRQHLVETPLALEVASATTVGLNPTRLVNEDACGYLLWSAAGASGPSSRALLCVADGMGGMEAGEVASQTALQTVLSAATSLIGAPPSDHGAGSAGTMVLDPVALVREAAPAVHAAGQGRQMGTTITCAVIDGDQLTLAHVGDTRAYLLREGALTRLTADHSLVAAMVASGVISREEARGHPDSNKVLRSLGSQRELPERYVDDLSAAWDEAVLTLRVGDWLLLCSDGVWGSVDDPLIRRTLLEALDPPAAARALIDHALRAGAPDNASAVVARCVALAAH